MGNLLRCLSCKAAFYHVVDQPMRCENCQELGSNNRNEPIIAQYRQTVTICEWDGCGLELGTSGIIDHIVPLMAGGETRWTNLRKLCERCNLRTLGRESDNTRAINRYDRRQRIKEMQELIDGQPPLAE